MSVISAMKLMPTKKQEIKTFHSLVKQALMEGRIMPLELLSNLKTIEKTVKDILSDNDISDEFIRSMQSAKRHEAYGCLFEEVETGVKYGYDVSSDWNEVNEEIKLLEEKRKAIESRLKTASVKCPYLDTTTGEAILGIGKSSKTTIKLTLK